MDRSLVGKGLRDGSVLIASTVAIYLLSPYLFILNFIKGSFDGKLDEFFWAFKNSIIQAFFSAGAAVLVGFCGAMALISWGRSSRKRRCLEFFFVLPGFLPPIFLILALFSIGNRFPVGISGVVIAHTISCFGVIATILARQMEVKLARFSDIAAVLGSNRSRFFLRVALPVLRRDLSRAFVLVFLICLASFSIPLLMGGGLVTTLEILIYEKIRNAGHWGEAVTYSLAQSVIILTIVWARRGLISSDSVPLNLVSDRNAGLRQGSVRLLRSPFLAILASVGIFYVLFCYLHSVFLGFARWGALVAMLAQSWQPLVGSIFFALMVGLLLTAIFLAILYCLPMQALEKFLSGYLAPSTALSSFAFLSLGVGGELSRSLMAVLVLVLIYLTALFRIGINSRFRDLLPQICLAETLGASRTLIYRKIILPQILGTVLFASGIGAVWASGDFAVTRLFSQGDSTLGLVVQSLAASYRLELAGALSVVLLAAGATIFLLFLGASYVVDKKSQA